MSWLDMHPQVQRAKFCNKFSRFSPSSAFGRASIALRRPAKAKPVSCWSKLAANVSSRCFQRCWFACGKDNTNASYSGMTALHPGPRRCAPRAGIRRSCPHTRVVLSTSSRSMRNVISMIPGSTIWSTKNHCIIRGPVGRTHGQTLLFYRYRFTQSRDELFTNEKDCFDQKAILNRKECPDWTSLLTLHRVMNIQYYDLRSNQLQLKDEQKEWDARKEFEKKKPVKRQSWSAVQWNASTRPSAAGHGSKPEWTCYSWPSLVRVFMTSCFLHEKESPCCLCPLPIASRWSVTVSALCRRVPY